MWRKSPVQRHLISMVASAQTTSPYQRAIAMGEEVVDHWTKDDAPRLAASLAYYTILSSAPLLVLSVALAGSIFGEKAVQGQLAWEIQTMVGGQAAQAIQDIVRNAHQPATGVISTVLSIVTLIVGASSVIVELHSALNKVWNVPDSSTGTWLASIVGLIKERFRSALLVIGAGCLLLASLVVSLVITAVGKFFRSAVPLPEWIMHLIAFAFSFIVVTMLFAAIYKLLPDVHLRWSDVIIGASVNSLLFSIGKMLLAIYLGHVGFESTYGAAWTLVILLVWVYYSAQLFFLGAEFTKVYARHYGSHSDAPAGAAAGEKQLGK